MMFILPERNIARPSGAFARHHALLWRYMTMNCRRLFHARLVLAVGCAGLAAHAPAAQPVISWVPTAGGTYAWNSNANWTGNFPNAAGAAAKLSLNIINDQTINLN